MENKIQFGEIDKDIESAYGYFASFLKPEIWTKRKEKIESKIQSFHTRKPTVAGQPVSNSLSISDDRSGWYLYLVECYLQHQEKYEPLQGCRILPVFKRFGTDLAALKQIKGIDNAIDVFLHRNLQNPDTTIFEMLVALLWKRNGWSTVEFIKPKADGKSPDIRAVSGSDEWYIECKRLAKTSEYSELERQKWLKMWAPFGHALGQMRLPYIFDIEFHVELRELPDDYLIKKLLPILERITPPCAVASDQTWTVSVDTAKIKETKAHLKKYFVRYPSEQLNLLVAGRREPNRGFTAIMEVHGVTMGTGPGNNVFVDDVKFCAGSFWSCDAEQAIETKARDIRTRLAQAVEQLPKDKRGVVHFGIETVDGALVEMERYRRIVDTLFSFDAKGKSLNWIYCHLLQSYSPPDEAWVQDETVYIFGNARNKVNEPLSIRSTIVPDSDSHEAGVHWLREQP